VVISYLRTGASRESPCIKVLIHANARERVKHLGVHCAWPKEGVILKLWSPYEVCPGILTLIMLTWRIWCQTMADGI